MKFCVKYEVDGKTYWDNNNGNNYSLKIYDACFGKSSLFVREAEKCTYSDNTQKLFLTMAAKKFANAGLVKVRYTTDNWATYTDTNATLKSTYTNDNDVDSWALTITSPANTFIQYAVCYSVNGVEYWDNNFGSNYNSNTKIND
jgi:hypothetical protein